MPTKTETDLLSAFYDDWGRNGNPLGDLARTEQIGDGRSDDRVYVAELHHNSFMQDRSTISVWEKLEGYEWEPDAPSNVYPKDNHCWNQVFQTWYDDKGEAREVFERLSPEAIEQWRENERPEQ